jgi:hypothetical protein
MKITLRKKFLFIAFSGLLLTASCKKKDTPIDNPPTPPPTGSVKIIFDNVAGASDLQMNTGKYVTQFGDSLSVSLFKYYVSNIKLTASDNSAYSEPESYHLIDEDISGSLQFTLVNIPQKNYSSITFMLGVDSTHNVSGAQSGALDPVNGMFWSWNSGYVMAKVEGVSSGTSIVFHVGGFEGADKVQRTVTLHFPNTANVTSTVTPSITIKSDVLEWFKTPTTIDFASLSALAMPGPEAKSIADNYADMCKIAEVKN